MNTAQITQEESNVELFQWQPISTFPKGLTKDFDLYAKYWNYSTDKFEYKRFPDCYWRSDDVQGQWKAGFVGVDKGWRPVAWMQIPKCDIE